MKRCKILLIGCAAPLALVAGTAQAAGADKPVEATTPPAAVPAPVPATDAQPPQEKAAPARDSSAVDDIVVTAQRREQRLQEIPVVVSAFTSKTLDQLHVADAISMSKFVPGMISQHNAGLGAANSYFLRGLGNSLSTATFDSPVTTYVDDVYIARQNANNYAFFDTERVEVLRGPQGTLFGRNTTGGAVSVILRKPSDKFGVSAEATGGSYNRFTLRGTVDAPLSDTVRTKLSGYVISDRGFLKNITTGDRLNGEHNYGVRGDVRFLPSSNLTIDLAAEYTQNSSTYGGVRSIAAATPNIYLNPAKLAAGGALNQSIFYETAAGLPKTDCTTDSNIGSATGNTNVNRLLTTGRGFCGLSRVFAATANVAYDFAGGTLNYIFGYRHMLQGYIGQYDANNINKFAGYIIADNSEDTQWSHELKYSGDLFNDRLHLVTGLYYLREKNDDRQTTFTGGTTAFNAVQDQHLKPEIETAAVYAQGDLDLTDKLTATLGGRFTYEGKTVDYFTSSQFTGGAGGYTSAQVAALGIPLKLTENRFTPRIALSYKASPDVLLFASATNGFKSGGWNGTASVPQNAIAFRPERTWSYEGGVKAEMLNHSLRFNLTGYLAITKDLQATTTIQVANPPPATGTRTASLPLNAGTLKVYGLELETNWQATPTLSFFANPSYMHARYTYIVPSIITTGLAFLSTATIPVRSPKFQFNGGINYMTVPADFGSVGGSVTYRHNSPYWVALLNTTKTTTENYVDAAVKYQTRDEKLTFSLEASNLTDQKTVTVNFLSLFPGDPRRYTARVKVKF